MGISGSIGNMPRSTISRRSPSPAPICLRPTLSDSLCIWTCQSSYGRSAGIVRQLWIWRTEPLSRLLPISTQLTSRTTSSVRWFCSWSETTSVYGAGKTSDPCRMITMLLGYVCLWIEINLGSHWAADSVFAGQLQTRYDEFWEFDAAVRTGCADVRWGGASGTGVTVVSGGLRCWAFILGKVWRRWAGGIRRVFVGASRLCL